MKSFKLLCLLLMVGITGCVTSYQLEDNTLHQGKSLTDLEYEMVLDNIAMFKVEPGALPWDAIVSKAAITINDQVSPSAGYKGGPPVRTIGISASRAWQGDWTITPVIDPTVLRNLRTIYTNAAADTNFQTGPIVPAGAVFSGHYGSTFVWVDEAHVNLLVDTTTNVLNAASSVTVPWLTFRPGKVYPFILTLQATNADFVSQFLSSQLPPGVKGLMSDFTNSASTNALYLPETTNWLTHAMEGGLNKTIDGWTTNEAYQFAASIQLTRPGAVRPGLKKTLNDPIQSNKLLEEVIKQLSDYYPGVFYTTTNSVSSLKNMLLLPGVSPSIQ